MNHNMKGIIDVLAQNIVAKISAAIVVFLVASALVYECGKNVGEALYIIKH